MVLNGGKIMENDVNTFDGPINNIFVEESVKVSISTFLSVFLVLSVVGNGCTCVVIVRNKSMRTPTNYYLLNLAVSDLVFSMFIPIEIYMYWLSAISINGSAGLLFHLFVFDFLSNCSVLTILAFTVERYLAITKPIFCRNMLASRVCKIITIIWLTSCSFSCLNLYLVYKVKKKDYASFFTTYFNEFHRYFVGVLLTVFFVLPMCIISVLFVRIVLHMNSTILLRTNGSRNDKNKKKAIQMLAAVAASFFICWSPYFMLRAMLLLKLDYQKYECVWRVCIYLGSINSYMSAVVNPILYSLMSRKFRQAFKNLIRRKNASKDAAISRSLNSSKI